MFDHSNLKIWQRAHELSLNVDRALKGRARKGPPGLASQLSRACASMAANIAESAGQDSPVQTARFLSVSIASVSETENHVARAEGTGLLTRTQAEEFSKEVRSVRRMTVNFRTWVLARVPERESKDSRARR